MLARFSVGATPLRLDLFSTYSCILLTVEQKSTCTGIGNRYRPSFVIYGLFAQKCEYYKNFNQLQNYLCIIRICNVDCQVQKYVMKDGSLCFKHRTVATWSRIQEYGISSSMLCNFCSKQFFISFTLFSDDDITLVLVR